MAEKTNGAAPKKAEAAGINKMECVREAMAKLGFDAGRADIQSFVKRRFGVEMNLDIISTYKADIARKAAQAKPTEAKMPVTPPLATAAKTAVAPKPPVIAVPTPAVKKPATSAPVAKKPAVPAPKPQAKPSASANGNGPASGGGIGLSDIQAVKDLVGKVGANHLKTLIDLLS